MSSILQYLLLLGFSWNVCQMCSLISNVARSDMWEIKYFDQCCAIDVSPTFHGNLDFSPRFSFIFAEACTLDKQDYHFISKCTSHSSIDLYAFVLADTQQKTVKNTGCGFFRWWRGWLGQYLREGGCKFQIHLVIRHLLDCCSGWKLYQLSRLMGLKSHQPCKAWMYLFEMTHLDWPWDLGVQSLARDGWDWGSPPAFHILPPVATFPNPPGPPDELKIKQHHGPRRNAHILLHPSIPSSMNDLIKLESGLGHPPVYLVRSDVCLTPDTRWSVSYQRQSIHEVWVSGSTPDCIAYQW